MHAAAARRIFEHGAGVLLLPVAPPGLGLMERQSLRLAHELVEITDATDPDRLGRFAVLSTSGQEVWAPIACPAPAPSERIYIGEAWDRATTGTVYRASGGQRSPSGCWRPAHQMPAGAARTVFCVVGRAALRFKDIPEATAARAGMPPGGPGFFRHWSGGASRAPLALRTWWEHWTGGRWSPWIWCWAIEVRKCAGGRL